jgi:hypothetical protein
LLPVYSTNQPQNKPACYSNTRNFGSQAKQMINVHFAPPFPMHLVSVTTTVKGYIGNLKRPSTKMDKLPLPCPFPPFYSSPRHLNSFCPHFTFPPRRQPKSSTPLLHHSKSTAQSFSPSPISLYSTSSNDTMAPGGKVV